MLRKKAMERTKELDKEASKAAVQPLFQPLKAFYKDIPGVVSHLEAIETNIVERSEDIHKQIKSDEANEGESIMNILVSRGAFGKLLVPFFTHYIHCLPAAYSNNVNTSRST